MNFGGRRSMYKNVFGAVSQGAHYSNLRITNDFGDSTGIKANAKYISAIWQTGGGGVFTVLPHGQEQRLPDNNIRFFSGHSAPVLDTDWNPFDDNILVSSSGDGTVGVWRVPDDYTVVSESDDVADIKPETKLSGHQKPVRLVNFNPSAGNVLASSSTDSSIIVWDIEHGSQLTTVKMDKPAASVSWDASGKYLVTVPQYGQPTIWDPRLNQAVIQFPTTSSSKARRVIWLGEQDKIVTTGKAFVDGQIALWDVKNPRAALSTDQWGQASSILTPFWDEGTKMLYVTIKGERTIKYYELHNNELESLFYFQGADAHSGVTFLPKRGVNVRAKELTRALRIIGGSTIEPVPFTLPRTTDSFIAEAYPPAVGLTPYASAVEWGADPSVAGVPAKFSLEGLWSGAGLTTVAKGESASTTVLKGGAGAAPASVSSATPASAASSLPAAAPAAAISKADSPKVDTVKQESSVGLKSGVVKSLDTPATTTSSIAAAASRFADGPAEEKDEDSAFASDIVPPARSVKAAVAAAEAVGTEAGSSTSSQAAASGTARAGSSSPVSSSAASVANKAQIEKLIVLGEKCKAEIETAQQSLATLAAELKKASAGLDADDALKSRIKALDR